LVPDHTGRRRILVVVDEISSRIVVRPIMVPSARDWSKMRRKIDIA